VITNSTLNIANVESQTQRMELLYDHLNIILFMLVPMATLVLLVSAMGMSSTMSINIMERTKEIGILRAIGATPKIIFKLFIIEGMIIALASTLLGLLMAVPFSMVASEFFGNLTILVPFEFAISLYGLGITLVVVLLFSYGASYFPAQQAMKLSAREALNYG